VGRELVESIILDAACAPPPFSGQVPWTFNVIEGVERIATYGERARRYAQERRSKEAGWSWLDRADFKIFWDAPVLIVISGPIEDCCRAGQNLMLAAHARGLGTCWVGSPMLWLSTAEAKVELGIPENSTPVSALCLGYAETVPATPAPARPTIIWA
jgi:nitroreductase